MNVEVVRSRSAREGPAKELTSFADRASAQVSEASALTDGLIALVGCVLSAQAAGTLTNAGVGGAGAAVELSITGDAAAVVLSDIERLASRIGVAVEQHGHKVILNVLPEGKSHSKD